MSTIHITKDGEPVLREVASEVPVSDITSTEIQSIIIDMREALRAESRFGVAIAAPQIGVSKRIFVVSGQVLGGDDEAFINPRIIKTSRKTQQSHESCLSIQGRPAERGGDVAGIVLRPAQVTIEYYDTNGTKRTRGAGKLLAAIFDHEIDHLDGTLFIDKAEELWPIDKDFNRVG